MSHRIGSVVAQSPAFVVGPGSGMGATSPGVWERTFSPPPHPDGTKFLLLHFTGASFGAGDRLEVVLSADPDPFHAMDVFMAPDGPNFWSRPVSGNSVVVRFVDGGDATGQVSITEYGRGEGIRNGGNTAGGGNANGDVFMIDASWDDPTFFNVAGVCPSGSNPSWENVAALPAGVMRETARRVGLFIVADGDHLSTCTATLIAPDLILTAGHCLATDDEARTGSFTLDFQTDASGNRPAPYTPRLYKLTRVVRSGFSRQPGDVRPGRDYSIVQVAVHPAGLGVLPAPMRNTIPGSGEEVFGGRGGVSGWASSAALGRGRSVVRGGARGVACARCSGGRRRGARARGGGGRGSGSGRGSRCGGCEPSARRRRSRSALGRASRSP
jgi:hypothetical protein